LVLFSALALSGAILYSFSLWQSQSAIEWPLEGQKAGQASIWGRYPNSSFGENIAVGDVNGDGINDLIAGARFSSETILGGGDVYVIPGPLDFNKSYSMPEKAALVFKGTIYDGQVGTPLDSGDINGDGLDDIVLGSWTNSITSVYLGSAEIESSSPLTITVTPQNMALTILSAIDGLVLCDLNGDSYQDLFMENSSWETGVQIWGILGRTSLTMTNPLTLTLPDDANILIQRSHLVIGGAPNPQNMACGDIDGDGYEDLAIGIYGESPDFREGAGVVYVIRGDPAISTENLTTIDMLSQAGAILEGVDGRLGSSGDEFGSSLAIADVDQDGRGDLIIGAPGASGPDNLIQYAGEVYLWAGRELNGQRFKVSDQASWIVHGEKTLEHLGRSIATGDFDNDGQSEILLGCSQCGQEGPPLYLSGRGYVLEPLQISEFVTVTAVSQLDILPYKDARCLGETTDAMDLDHDGFDDLLIGAPCTDYPEGNLPGTVYAISYPIHYKISLPLINR
jgi:hypothetical protein